MFRGRLIYPFTVQIARLDIAATAADPDGAGPLTTGLDPDFKEIVVLPTADGVGAAARAETLIKLPGQFVSTSAFADLQAAATGNLASVEFQILFHFRDLESLGLVDAITGSAKIKIGDRLNAIYDYSSGVLVQAVKNPPGAFITRAKPIFGLQMRRNLLECTFKSRDPGSAS